MIVLQCDKCDKQISVEDKFAGSKIECPHCGDINRVPESAAVPAPTASNAPTAEVDQPERELLQVRPSLWRSRPFTTSLIALAPPLLTIVGVVQDWAPLTNYWGWAIPLIAWIALLIWWFRKTQFELLRITSERSIYRYGLLSRNTSEVLHKHVRNIKIEQSFLQRVLSVGSIAIDGSAGGGDGDAEVVIKDVPHPRKLKALIDEHRDL